MKKIVLILPLITTSFLTSCQNSVHKLLFSNFGIVIEYEGKVFSSKDLASNRNYTFTIRVDDDFASLVSKPTQVSVKTTGGEDYKNYVFNPDNGELNISLSQDVVVTTNSVVIKEPTLEESSWSLINKICELDYASDLYNVGDEKTLKINNRNHKVRIIGFNHDNLTNKNGKAHITFEFMNPIETEFYGPYKCWWAYQKDNTAFVDQALNTFLNYERNSIYSILPIDLQNVIKDVDKEIATGSSLVVTTYSAKLFPLSYTETTTATSSDVRIEGETYQYYKEHVDDADRAKTNIDGDDPQYTMDGYFLRSPVSTVGRDCWYVDCKDNPGAVKRSNYEDGDKTFIINTEHPIVPAFCI